MEAMMGSIRNKRTLFLSSVWMKAALAALVGPHNLLSLLSEQVLPTVQSGHRGTSPMRNNPSLGPYSRLMPRAL